MELKAQDRNQTKLISFDTNLFLNIIIGTQMKNNYSIFNQYIFYTNTELSYLININYRTKYLRFSQNR